MGSRRVRAKIVPSGPTRKSARLHGPAAAMPSVEKAQHRAATRNLELTGLPSSSPFSVLQDLSDSHLASVVHDVGLDFAVETGREAEVLSLIRAKEAAQAAIAEAVFRREWRWPRRLPWSQAVPMRWLGPPRRYLGWRRRFLPWLHLRPPPKPMEGARLKPSWQPVVDGGKQPALNAGRFL